MNKRPGFVLLMLLIVVVTLVAVVSGVTILTTSRLKDVGLKEQRQKAFNLAEAGLHKAIWYLTKTPEEGGKGIDWRTSGEVEAIGGGSYTIVIQDDPRGIIITIIGSCYGSVREIQVLAGESFGGAFADYALMADGDLTINEGASIEGGTVAVTEGNQVSGDGSYTTGSESANQENVDTTYYDNMINTAKSGGEEVLQGDQTYTDINLNDTSLYVNGNVNLVGNISGGGEIISSGDITVGNASTVNKKTKLISDTAVVIEQGAKLKKDVVIYAKNDITLNDGTVISEPITLVTPNTIQIGKNTDIDGVIVGGSVTIGQGSIIEGSIASGSPASIDDATIIYVTYDSIVPPGFDKKIKINKWLKK